MGNEGGIPNKEAMTVPVLARSVEGTAEQAAAAKRGTLE
jgi:hypothetical protein